MTDIVYAANHGFAARMLMQTDLLGKLVNQGLSVGLIAPDESDDNLSNYCSAKDIALYEFDPPSTKWQNEYYRARKYLLDDIKANPCLWERHIKATKFGQGSVLKQIRPYLYYTAYRLRKTFPGIKSWFTKKEQKLLRNREAVSLFQKIKPALFVSTYPVNYTEGMLMQAAQKTGCPTYVHLLSWDNISGKGTFVGQADKYLLWGKDMAEELSAYYNVEQADMALTGVPHFDRHVAIRDNNESAKYLSLLGLNPQKPYLFFGMSASHFAPREIDIVEWLSDSIENGHFGENMQLVVRPHPQNVSGSMSNPSWRGRLDILDKKNKTAVFFPGLVSSKMSWSMREDDMEKLVHLIAGASLVYNSGSTISIDALMCDRPVVITSFDAHDQIDYWHSARRLLDYKHLKKITNQTGIDVARSFEELETLTKAHILDPRRNLELRRDTIKKYCANFEDGQATARVVDFLAKAVHQQVVLTTESKAS